jgi:hypothetical protein
MLKRSRTSLALSGLCFLVLALGATWLDERSSVGEAGKTLAVGLGIFVLWTFWNLDRLRHAWRANRAHRRS